MKLLFATFALMSLCAAQGATVFGTATWTATIGPTSSQGFVGQTFTGSATFSYDSDDVNLTGSTVLSGLVTTFSQNISTIGATTYDTSNVGYYVFFFNGAITQSTISGTPGNQGVASSDDDFFAQDIPGTLKRYAVSVATESGVAQVNPADVNFTFTVVPEPSSTALLGLAGVAALGLGRRRRS